MKTPLIMFPGWYNGILKPGVHYVELEKDFSNFDAVVNILRNDQLLEEIAENAYRDLIASGDYQASKLGSLVSDTLDEAIAKKEFDCEATKSMAAQSVRRIHENYRFQNMILSCASELRFVWGQFMKILSSPRFKGLRKLDRLAKGFRRYIAYLSPRIK